ncbi:MAG: carboxypeptidase regulatory-like domain-containing protein [Myxococcaceae bacterium]
MAGGFNNRITIVIALAVGLGLLAVVAGQLTAPPEGSRPEVKAKPAGKLAAPVHHEEPPDLTPPKKLKALPLKATASDSPKGEPGTFEGEVHDRVTGAGVPKAQLTFQHGDGAFSAVTDGAGHFSLEPREVGEWRLAEITAPGHRAFRPEWGQSPLVLIAEDGKKVEGLLFNLEPELQYRGSVVDDDGNGIDGVEVTAQGASVSGDKWTTTADGGFAFYAPQDSVLIARKDGYATNRAEVDYKVEITHRLEITLSRGDAGTEGPVKHHTGIVVDDQGLGVADAQIVIESVDRWTVELTTVSRADGRFAFDLPGNLKRVATASHPGYAEAVKPVGDEELTLTLGKGGRIVGRVIDGNSHPVPAFTVMVFRRHGLERQPQSTTSVVDANGNYTLTGVAAGELSVSAVAAGLASGTPVDLKLEVGEEKRADFVLPKGGDVDGLVVDKVSKKPLAGAVVEAEGNPGAGLPVDVEFQARTGPDGRFHLSGMPEKAKSLWCAAEGHHPRILSGVVAKEGQSTPVEIQLTPLKPGEDPTVELVGIGAVLKADADAILVVQAVPGGGAAEAGLQPMDEIVSVDGTTVAQLGFNGAVEAIRGPEDSTVRLEVRRSGTVGVYDVPRRALSH